MTFIHNNYKNMKDILINGATSSDVIYYNNKLDVGNIVVKPNLH